MMIYISGPMTIVGPPTFNFPAFNRMEKKLTELGHKVLNPARNFNGRTDLRRRDYMRLDLQHVMMVDALVLLPNWESSPGARAEVLVALELGLQFFDHKLNTIKPEVCTVVKF